MVLGGFWMDIGQPRDYLKGTGLYLSHIRSLQGETTQPVNESAFVEADWAQGNVLKVGSVDKAMRMVACDGRSGRELQGGSERGAGKGREAGRGLRGGERDDSRGHRAGSAVCGAELHRGMAKSRAGGRGAGHGVLWRGRDLPEGRAAHGVHDLPQQERERVQSGGEQRDSMACLFP